MAVKNYYTVLGVKQTDTDDTIKKAYRKLAKKYHPDLNPGDKAAEARMREISEAYEMIGDTEKRKKYDAQISGGHQQKPFTAGGGSAPRSNPPMTQEDFYNMGRSFENMLGREAIKNSVNRSKPTGNPNNPIDTTDFFEQVMGFKGPGAKAKRSKKG